MRSKCTYTLADDMGDVDGHTPGGCHGNVVCQLCLFASFVLTSPVEGMCRGMGGLTAGGGGGQGRGVQGTIGGGGGGGRKGVFREPLGFLNSIVYISFRTIGRSLKRGGVVL